MKSISFNGAPEVKYSRVSPGEVKDFEKFIKGHYHRQDSNFSKSGAHVVRVITKNEYNVMWNPQAQFLEKVADIGTFELFQEAPAQIHVKEAIEKLRCRKIQYKECSIEKIVENFQRKWEESN